MEAPIKRDNILKNEGEEEIEILVVSDGGMSHIEEIQAAKKIWKVFINGIRKRRLYGGFLFPVLLFVYVQVQQNVGRAMRKAIMNFGVHVESGSKAVRSQDNRKKKYLA